MTPRHKTREIYPHHNNKKAYIGYTSFYVGGQQIYDDSEPHPPGNTDLQTVKPHFPLQIGMTYANDE